MSPDPTDAPGIPIPDALLVAAESAINAVLALDPEGAAKLAPVQGLVLRVVLTGFGTRVDIVPGDGELRLFGDYASEPDCTVRGTPAALLAMTLSDHQEDQVFHGAVEITGDSRVAQDIGDALRGLDIDWEERLSRVFGDGIANRLGEQGRAGARWAEQTGAAFTADLREYLTEEGRLLPGDLEMRGFLADVDTLRDDVERFEARLERLARTLGAPATRSTDPA